MINNLKVKNNLQITQLKRIKLEKKLLGCNCPLNKEGQHSISYVLHHRFFILIIFLFDIFFLVLKNPLEFS